MASPIFAWFTGESQGVIDGWGSWPNEDDIEGRGGGSIIYQFDHEITIPTDPQSGQAAGPRTHRPVRIIKRINKASPMLYQALCTGEVLSEVVFKWFRVAKTGMGKAEHFYTTKLDTANIVAIKEWFPITLDEAQFHYPPCEDILITYRKIIWTWEIDGIEAEDDWKVQ